MLKVINTGIYSSIQDQGRFGFAQVGVPVSGVMDEFSANTANIILSNPLESAVLEITLGLAKFQFLSPTTCCVSGASCTIQLNGVSVNYNQIIKIKEKDILSFGSIKNGVRSYLAVKNGFQTEKRLKSKSQFKNITSSAFLKKNDVLYYEPYSDFKFQLNARLKINNLHFNNTVLKCFKGVEFDLLSTKQQKLLFTTRFIISKDNNRMGYRFTQKIPNSLSSMLTSAVLPGTVQLTPSGNLIALMKDCQVTGGYPRILQLTREAIAVLSQKTTNQYVNFVLKPV